jgi:hypothetical protein
MKNLIFKLLVLVNFFIVVNTTAQLMEKKPNEIETNYKRSSLYTLMLTDSSRDYEQDIKTYFVDKVVPDKYNNHNLENRFILSTGSSNELDNVVKYLNDNKIANQLISKWFNRSSKGGFNMNLIKERGYYDASILDITTAKSSVRGLALLADAGEELINNTFILVNDSRYTNKEEVASTAKSIFSIITENSGISLGTEVTKLGLDTFGKGFVVKTKSHLFKLVWDEETQSRFYNELWADDKTITPEKKAAFDNANFFYLDYIGTDTSWADVQSTSFTSKSNSELIGKATVKSIDNVITKLQKNYDVFKTKTPLYSSDPLCAKIGLKEGVNKKTKFEVLEQQIDESGNSHFVRVGIVKVDTRYPIWDNRFAADEENPNQNTDKTYFKSLKGKDFYTGLLLRQIK